MQLANARELVPISLDFGLDCLVHHIRPRHSRAELDLLQIRDGRLNKFSELVTLPQSLKFFLRVLMDLLILSLMHSLRTLALGQLFDPLGCLGHVAHAVALGRLLLVHQVFAEGEYLAVHPMRELKAHLFAERERLESVWRGGHLKSIALIFTDHSYFK